MLFLGNLDSQRDWGHAKDYVKMMWMILQASKADDWVIATGKTNSVREFVRLAFKYLVEIEFKGEGVVEKVLFQVLKIMTINLKLDKRLLMLTQNTLDHPR